MKNQKQSEFLPYKEEYWFTRGSRKLLNYTGPPLRKNLNLKEIKEFVDRMGVWGAMWNYDYEYANDGPWYRCICDSSDYDMDKIESKNARHNLRRSLKRCEVRPVDFTWLADKGYDVYAKASSRYKNFKVKSKEEYSEELKCQSRIPGAEAFGAFSDDNLIAYMTLFICQDSVRGDAAHFDPDYSKAYPMYALYYTVTYHYLRERGFREFDRGTRPLIHETNIDDFLLRLRYRKSYCRLGFYVIRPVRYVMVIAKMLRWLGKFVLTSRYYAILEGLFLAEDIARQTKEE
ncbi:MAG: hypothetical protein ACYTFM_01785 [Planctomycetota bacterium]|jgi:hypothetical protein